MNTKATDVATATGNDLNHDVIALRAVCVSELDRYLRDVINKGACPMYDADDAFNNPLKWWKENWAKYPYVALANTLPFLRLQHHQNEFGTVWQKKCL